MASGVVDQHPGGLAGSEAEYRKLANALPQIIWTCDAQGRLEWVNDRWMELTGLSEEESLNDKGALVAVHPDDRERGPASASASALATSSPCEIEYRIRTREGAYRYHVCAGRAGPQRGRRRSRAGWPRRSTCTIAARPRRRCARRSGGSRRSSISIRSRRPSRASPTARYLSVNDAFLRLTGLSRDEVVGKTAVELGIWTAEQRVPRSSPTLRPRRDVEITVSHEGRDGAILTLRCVSAPASTSAASRASSTWRPT